MFGRNSGGHGVFIQTIREILSARPKKKAYPGLDPLITFNFSKATG